MKLWGVSTILDKSYSFKISVYISFSLGGDKDKESEQSIVMAATLLDSDD